MTRDGEELDERARGLLALLDEWGVAHATTTHAPAFTVDDARALRGAIPGAHTKNLFLKDKKGRLFLVVALEDARVELKRLHRALGCARLSFGKPELLEEVLGVRPGSVTPFALINDSRKRVRVVLDENLLKFDQVNFHPLINTATTTISREDFLAFLKRLGCEPLIIDVAGGENAAEEKG